MMSLLVALMLVAAPSRNVLEPGALEQLERVYQQSCAERSYGSYNDMCDQMRGEIRSYRRAMTAERRSSRRPAATGGIAPASAAPVTPSAAASPRPALRDPPQTTAPQR